MQTKLKKIAFMVRFVGILTFLLNFIFTGVQAQKFPDQPGYYRMQVGDAEVVTLLDGTYMLNVAEHLHGTSKENIQKIMRGNYQDSVVELTFSAFLVRTRDQLVLVDAGSGGFMGAGLGNVTKNLRAVGFEPRDITAVLITHGHADHLGGLVNGKDPVFPNATVFLAKAELDYWLSDENKQKASPQNAPFFALVQAAMAPYIKAGRVKTFDSDGELLPGISAIGLHGHTPGHSAYLLESGGQHMLFVGDLVHIEPIQFENPAISIDYDVDQRLAVRTRQKEFGIAEKNGYWIAAPHMSFPGIGHIKVVGKGYQWIPAHFSVVSGKN